MKSFKKILILLTCNLFISAGMLFPVYAAEPFELHVLDVGQGQSVLIEADSHYVLIDGGGREASSFVVSYVKQQGIEKLDYMAVSHYDEDHMSGVIGALNVFPCDVFLAPGYAGSGDLYQSLAAAAFSNGCDIIHPETGTVYEAGNARIEVIGPVRKDYGNDNDMSLCFRIGYGDRHFIICGDAESSSELDLVESGTDISADIYVVDHHGSSTSSMDAFLNAVSPSYAVISCGSQNGYGHPAMETMQRLQNHGISMYRTDVQGTVIACSDGNDIWFDLDPSDNWSAGTAALTLDADTPSGGVITRQAPLQEEESAVYDYVCNTNTRKFHYPDCKSVDQIKEENRLNTNLSRDELIAEGYKPCGNCNP